MPESRWITHSVRNPNPSLPTVTWPENPPSKYFAVASAIRSLMRERNASPTSMFLPETRNDIWPASDLDHASRLWLHRHIPTPPTPTPGYAHPLRHASSLVHRIEPGGLPDGGPA